MLALSESSADRFPAPNANGAAAFVSVDAGVAFAAVVAAAADDAGFEAPNEKPAPVLAADPASAGFSVAAAAGFEAPKENTASVAGLASDAALAALGAPKENAGAAAVDADAVEELSVFAAGAAAPVPAPNLNGAADPLEALPPLDDAPELGCAAAAPN